MWQNPAMRSTSMRSQFAFKTSESVLLFFEPLVSELPLHKRDGTPRVTVAVFVRLLELLKASH